MKRLTTDQPRGIMQTCLNLFYAKDGEAWARDEGPGPLHKDVRLFDFIREAIRATVDEERDYVADFSDEELGEVMLDWLADGNTSIEGLIGTLYTAAWAFAEIRERLKAYEDTGLEPEEILTGKELAEVACAINRMKDYQNIGTADHLRGLVQAEKAGRLVALPCKVGDTVYRVVGGEIQKHSVSNVMYRGLQNRWQIDCTPFLAWAYDEFGKTVFLTHEEAEAALKGENRGTI